MANCQMKFMAYNLLDSGTATFSSADSDFPGANAYHSNRGKYWLPSGNFVIDAGVNDDIYITDDGGSPTITLTAGEYTASGLASHIQTKLNATSSNWTCTYSTTTRKFTISRSSGTAVIRLSNQSGAVWNTIGFTGTDNRSVIPFLADEPRKHYPEYVQIDAGVATEIDFIGVVGPIDEVFGIGLDATVVIKGNNVDLNWPTAPYSETITPTERGIFHHLDADQTKYYRYWRLEIYDGANADVMKLGYIYIGSAFQPTSSNVQRGFSRAEVDPSRELESENGHLYFDQRTRYTEISAADIAVIDAADRLEIERIGHTFGKHTPFFISFDPLEQVSDSADELSWYVHFQDAPGLQHVFLDYYSIAIRLREAV